MDLKTLEQKQRTTAWIMMSPALMIMSAVAVYPILNTFWLSLHKVSLTDPGAGRPFIGLENYAKAFQDLATITALKNTLYFTLLSVTFELILGFAAALVMNNAFRGRGLVRAAVLIPWAIPTSVSALMWKFIYNDQYGLFNDLLLRFGVIDEYQAWLGNPKTAMFAIVLTDVWKTAPFIALLILAGLQMIPETTYESAKIDGAGLFSRFLFITLPLVKHTILVALLFRTMDAFRVFDIISVMTGGANNTESISIYAYRNLMTFMDFGYGSALSVLTFAGVFLISMVYMRLMGNRFSAIE